MSNSAQHQPELFSSPLAVEATPNMTASELAAMSIPTLPVLPFHLLDPLSPISSTALSHDTSLLVTKSQMETSPNSVDSLLAPFLSAYESQRRTLLASDTSLKRLHANCTSDLKAAIRSAEKRSLAKMNHNECESQHDKLTERICRCESEEAKLKREIQDKHEKLEAMKIIIHEQGRKIEADTEMHLEGVQHDLEAKSTSLQAVHNAVVNARTALAEVRTTNIELFMELQSLQSEHTRLGKTGGEIDTDTIRQKRFVASLESRQTEIESSIRFLQKNINVRQGKLHEKFDVLDKLRKEEADFTHSLTEHANSAARMKLEDEEAAQHEKEERMKLQSVQADNARSQEEMNHLSKMLDNDVRNLISLKRERKKKKQFLKWLRDTLHTAECEILERENEKLELECTFSSLKEEENKAQVQYKQTKDEAELQSKQHRLLQSQVEQSQDLLKAIEHTLKMKENSLQTLDSEIHSFHAALIKLETQLKETVNETQKYQELRDDVKAKCVSAQMSLEEASILIVESRASCEFLRVKLTNQSALLTSMHADRDQYRVSLIDLHSNLKSERAILVTKKMDVEEVRKRIAACDRALAHTIHEKEDLEEELHSINQHIAELQSSFNTCEEHCRTLVADSRQLLSLCVDANNEEKVQTTQFSSVDGECRVLTQQLMSRDSELHQVYDSLRLMQSRLTQTEATRKKLTNMKKDKEKYLDTLESILQTVLLDVSRIQELKSMIAQAQERLISAQKQERALEDEGKTVINIHRWRSLRDGQGELYSIVQQLHTLQKRIIDLQAQTEDKDREIEAQVKLAQELKRIHIQSDLVASSVEEQEIQRECDDKKTASKAVLAELHASLQTHSTITREVSLAKKERKALTAQWFSQRAADSNKGRCVCSQAEHKDTRGDEDFLQSELSFVHYDAAGERIDTAAVRSEIMTDHNKEV